MGRSLGINNIPPKTCTYSCVYCQLGRTTNMTMERQPFYGPEAIFQSVKGKLAELTSRNEKIDYLTFVPDGEPTLDLNLGRAISLLKQIKIPVAVLTNASLIWQEDVKEDLLKADLVSLKIDASSEELWKKIDRPYKGLKLNRIQEGIKEFARSFPGEIITETMLIDGVDYSEELLKIADFLKDLKNLDKAYIAIPTRPPAERWVRPAEEKTINHAFQVFSEALGAEKVEYLIGYEGNAFSFTGEIEEDLLSIMSVHPMRQEAVSEFLRKADSGWPLIERLLGENKIVELEYQGNKYYMRRLKK
ncbi:MAG: radical SAM protein [Caldisericota bacterium]|nr:radical SAM protein [Caldisericota bacterium]